MDIRRRNYMVITSGVGAFVQGCCNNIPHRNINFQTNQIIRKHFSGNNVLFFIFLDGKS